MTQHSSDAIAQIIGGIFFFFEIGSKTGAQMKRDLKNINDYQHFYL